MKDKAERSTHKTNVYMGGGGRAGAEGVGYTWPWSSNEHNRRERPIETWNHCVTPTII